MAELADALDSGSSRGSSVKVQVLLPAPLKALKTLRFRGFSLSKVLTDASPLTKFLFAKALCLPIILPRNCDTLRGSVDHFSVIVVEVNVLTEVCVESY